MVSEGIKTFLSCSHFRAIDYFLESITDTSKCLHMAYECKSYDEFLKGICGHCHSDSHLCSEMGYRANLYFSQQLRESRQQPVKMYFATSKKRPFCCKLCFHYSFTTLLVNASFYLFHLASASFIRLLLHFSFHLTTSFCNNSCEKKFPIFTLETFPTSHSFPLLFHSPFASPLSTDVSLHFTPLSLLRLPILVSTELPLCAHNKSSFFLR